MSNSSDTIEKDADGTEQDVHASIREIEYQAMDHEYRRRKWMFPAVMFVLTILSTFWAGVSAWSPDMVIFSAFGSGSAMVIRQCLIANWETGLLFSLAVIGILLAHEMGHYVMTRIYRVVSSYPIFIPFPFNAFGTCGAVIMMDGRSADRKEIFDIGIAGPLAGLVIALPVAALGLLSSDVPEFDVGGGFRLGVPLLFQFLDQAMGTEVFAATDGFSPASVSPLLMAAWIGLFVTGLNMMPMSQLDGGHVTFGLLGRLSDYVAYTAFTLCVAYVIFSQQYPFVLMLVLILLLKLRHPPSRDDTVRIGWFRSILAIASLSLPILCIPAKPLLY